MGKYRFYYLNASEIVRKGIELDEPDDSSARRRAERILTDSPYAGMEVWQDSRLVCSVNKRATAEAGADHSNDDIEHRRPQRRRGEP